MVSGLDLKKLLPRNQFEIIEIRLGPSIESRLKSFTYLQCIIEFCIVMQTATETKQSSESHIHLRKNLISITQLIINNIMPFSGNPKPVQSVLHNCKGTSGTHYLR